MFGPNWQFVTDWQVVPDWLLRYYFPVLFLLPIMLGLCVFDRRLSGLNRQTLLILCIQLFLLIFVDVVNEPLSKPKVFSNWRLIFSVLGFIVRPSCLLVLLLDSIPEILRSRKKMFLVCFPTLVNTLAFLSAFFCPLTIYFDELNDYHRGPLFPVTIVVSALYLILLTVFALTRIQKRGRRKAFSILTITLACFIASIMEMNGIAYPTPLLNQAIAIGTTLYFLIQYMVISSDTIENMTLSLLLMQIRPHFINNSLAAIRGMIRKDPDEATEALNHFSGYLQDTMNSILKTNLIPFSQELSLIDNYLYMEKARFRDSITVTKNLLEADFPVPPLTIQPLVENAVRHGLRGIQKPGFLNIRTEKDDKEYRVVITDNGCGFDPSKPPDPSRPHVGLKNVRTRLSLMCNGTLTIESSPEGTVSTVHIPAKNMVSLQAASGEKK